MYAHTQKYGQQISNHSNDVVIRLRKNAKGGQFHIYPCLLC